MSTIYELRGNTNAVTFEKYEAKDNIIEGSKSKLSS